MLCKCHWIVLYTVHFTAYCLGGPFFPGHGVGPIRRHRSNSQWKGSVLLIKASSSETPINCIPSWAYSVL